MTSSGVDGCQLRAAGGVTRRYLTVGPGSTLGLVDSAGAGAACAYEPFGRTYVAGNDGGNNLYLWERNQPRLPQDWNAHHRIPQYYRNDPQFEGWWWYA